MPWLNDSLLPCFGFHQSLKVHALSSVVVNLQFATTQRLVNGPESNSVLNKPSSIWIVKSVRARNNYRWTTLSKIVVGVIKVLLD